MNAPLRQLPMLQDAVRVKLETRRARRAVSVLRLHESRPLVKLRRAEPADAPAIHALLEQFVAGGAVLPRTLEQIFRVIRDFVVAEEDGVIVGCGALRIYTQKLAEVGALAVAPSLQGQGIGARIVETLVADAKALRIKRVFALTMQLSFFEKQGFGRVDVSEFPEKIAADCAACPRRERCPEIAVARTV